MKYEFSRAKWHIAEFNDEQSEDIFVWCQENFGPHPKQPDAWSRWNHRYVNKIFIRDEKDYILFILRWS